MNIFQTGQKFLSFAVLGTLSLLGLKSANANPPQVSQVDCTNPQDYARVITDEDPLNVRRSPDGDIIGSIPKGWAVVVQGKDATGEWTRVTSHFGEIGNFGFASAENFRSGWVATRFLRPMGRYCMKPAALLRVTSELFARRPVVVNEDWTQRGDRYFH
ncbi:MAG: hypothetical protein F6K03_16185 [Kamptonema sp. SIO4C4]|nr:hypothetical protein [Kamptonema sp. SIO4C4]